MARDDAMHQRLVDWAQWRRVGDGSGYPTMSVLHEDWTPPSPGITPTMKVAAPSAARQTNRVVGGLSGTLRDAVYVYYCYPSMTLAQRGERIGASEGTLIKRVERAQVLLRQGLEDMQSEYRHLQETG